MRPPSSPKGVATAAVQTAPDAPRVRVDPDHVPGAQRANVFGKEAHDASSE